MFLGLSEDKRGLKSVFESKKILKIFHDVRSDWDSLLHQYSVRIYNFIDTQEAFFIFKLFYSQDVTRPISLHNLIGELLRIDLQHKHMYKNLMASNPTMWAVRPIPEEHLAYASEDVVYLIEAWEKMKISFNKNLEEIVCFLTIIKVIDGNIFGQFKEFIIANILYYGMLANVFSTKQLFTYFIEVDYVYDFLKIKLISDETIDNVEASAIIKYGIHFKIKQRIDVLSRERDSRMEMYSSRERERREEMTFMECVNSHPNSKLNSERVNKDNPKLKCDNKNKSIHSIIITRCSKF